MVIAITPDKEREYVLRHERTLPEEQQTRFRIRTLTTRERTSLQDRQAVFMQATGEMLHKTGTYALETLRCGLVGWSNLKNSEGSDVPFETEEKKRNVAGILRRPVTDSCIDMLAAEYVDELAAAIHDFSRLGEDDTKD